MKKWSRFLSLMLAVAIAFSGIALPKMQVEAGVNDLSNPEKLTLGDSVWTPGNIVEEGAAHFYSVTLPKTGWLTINYQGWSIKDSYYEVLDADAAKQYTWKSVTGSSDTNPKTSSATLALEQGSYIIKVGGRWGGVGDYRLKASFKAANNNESTNNNDFTTAQKLSYNQTVTGFFSMDDRIDFFRIDLVKRERIRLIYTSYINASHMDVYNKDFQVISSKDIWSASENSPKTYEYQETLDPGTYYIKLWPHNDDCGRYRIQYKQKIIAKSIAISANKSKVLAGKRVKLSAKISPTNATDKTVRWTSGDRWVASVDENTGMVTTHSAGIVKITASAMDGSGISKVYTLVVWPKKMSAPYGSSPKSKQLYISYGSQSGAKGYEVQYATNSKFRGAKSKRTSKTSFTVKGVQKNRVYYIRVRAYVQRGKSMYRGDWSKTKKVRIK